MPKPPKPDPLRERLAKALRLASIEPEVWRHLVDEGYVETARDPADPDVFDDLVDAARRARRLAGSRKAPSPGKRTRSIKIQGEPGPVVDRAKAFSAYLARVAAEDDRVVAFRTRVLGGRLLTPKEAEFLVDSDILRFLDLEQLARFEVPVIGHRSRTVSRAPDGHEAPSYWIDRSSFHIRVGDREFSIPYSLELMRRISRSDCPVLEIVAHVRAEPWTAGAFRDRSGKVLPGSVLDELRQVSVHLAQRFHWPESRASWFALTGNVPYVSPLRVKAISQATNLFERLEIVLTVEPWVTPAELLRAYRQARKRVLIGQHRHLSKKKLALFEFLMDLGVVEPSDDSWERLMGRWNEQCIRGWRYGDRRVFRRDFMRVYARVVWPRYEWV